MRLWKFLLPVFAALVLLFSSAPAYAQKCEGPAELCAQVTQLRQALEAQKKIARDDEAKDANDVQKAKIAQRDADEKSKEERMAKLIALAASIAVGLKILVSMLTAWKGYFQTDRAKAFLKLGLVGFGFASFFATNIGFGIPWWQALVLAGGGPGAILVHELVKMIPVLRGQKKYADVDPDGDPTNPDIDDKA